MPGFDRIIRGGSIVDGKGHKPYTADIGIKDGCIAAIGRDLGSATETINADGLTVTPGWVDIHTHYDAQATWDPILHQSTWHGVTSLVMGNCGVGFAPAKPRDRQWLIKLMEGVEDIPGVSLNAGMDWRWESFPEYMDALDAVPRVQDIGTQVPHGALRTYVMGERGANHETATADDLKRMSTLVSEAIAAGALGFSTSRTEIHIDVDGNPVPGTYAGVEELTAIAKAIKSSGGLMEMVLSGVGGENCEALDKEMELLRQVAEGSNCPMTYLQVQHNADADQWRRQMAVVEQAARDGYRIAPQVAGRPISILFSMAGEHPWQFMPSYKEVADLPVDERIARLRDPAFRARLLAEDDPNETGMSLLYKAPDTWDMTYVAGSPMNYAPNPEDSIAAIARREGRTPQEVAYDALLERDGRALLMYMVTGYASGNVQPVNEMIRHPASVLGLSDAGAHCRFVCDGGVHTFMLSQWSRDCDPDDPLYLPLEFIVQKLSGDNAKLFGLNDRGVLEPGRRADVNLIDLSKLENATPEMHYDLPADQPRLLSKASGYVGTYVKGELVQADGEITDARPGGVIRAGH